MTSAVNNTVNTTVNTTMNTAVESLVEGLSEDDRWLVVQEFDSFRDTGVIGDSLIRTLALALIFSLGADKTHVAKWMCDIAFECWKQLALEQRFILDGLRS